MKRIVVFALALLLAVGAARGAFGEASARSAEKGEHPAAEMNAVLPGSMEPEDVVVAIDEKRFPDAAFRACVAADLDANGDGMLSTAERGIAILDVSGRGISSLKGVEFFTELEYLCFRDNAVTKLDTTENRRLLSIDGSRNALRRLDLSCNTALQSVEIEDNQLKSVDLTGCGKLTRLDLAGNVLKELDLKQCPRLQYLDVTDNKLTRLSLSKNRKLEALYCGGNRLASLNLQGNGRLERVVANGNALSGVNLAGCKRLVSLDVRDNALGKLNAEGKARLVDLRCDDNRIGSLKLGGCRSLETLSCADNRLKVLDASGCAALTALTCARNSISQLDVSRCGRLTALTCDDNRLNWLDVSGCAALRSLSCARNCLTTLDMSGNPALEALRCPENQLKRVDVHANAALTVLECRDNRIGFFDIGTLSDGLRALALNDVLRTVEGDALHWTGLAPLELSLPDGVTLMDHGKVVYGWQNVERNLSNAMTDDRRDYPWLTDAAFANFRNVATTGMGHNALYRSSSPIRTAVSRAREADAAAAAAGVRTILNLSDDADVMRGMKGYPGSYYSAQNVLAMRVPNSGAIDASRMRLYVEFFRYMIANEGPYLVHCIYGRDRTGSACALLECLMGATADEVCADYMETYYNYYDIVPGTEVYDYILNNRIVRNLKEAFGGADITQPGVDPATCAEALLLRSGMTPEEIAALRARLAADY